MQITPDNWPEAHPIGPAGSGSETAEATRLAFQLQP